MPRVHPVSVVEKALEALRRSADENGGSPNLSGVSRETGLSRNALRSWWQQRVEDTPVQRSDTRPTTPLHVLPKAKETLFQLDELQFLEAQALNASRLLAAAERDRSYVAAGKFFTLQTELYESLQVARQTAADASALDEAAFIERMEEDAAEMPDPHLEIYVREYLDRHHLQLGPRTGTGG